MEEIRRGWFAFLQMSGKNYMIGAKTRRELFTKLSESPATIEIINVIKGEIFDVDVRQTFYLSKTQPKPKPNVN